MRDRTKGRDTTPGKLKAYAEANDVVLETFIPQQIEKLGSVRQVAIKVFKCSPGAIWNWINTSGIPIEIESGRTAKVVRREKRQPEIAS